jgi:hypothetical protein
MDRSIEGMYAMDVDAEPEPTTGRTVKTTVDTGSKIAGMEEGRTCGQTVVRLPVNGMRVI